MQQLRRLAAGDVHGPHDHANIEELKRINQVVKTLCDKYAYIPESANDLLQYVSSIMAREKKEKS